MVSSDDDLTVMTDVAADALRVLEFVASIPTPTMTDHRRITSSMPYDVIEAARRVLAELDKQPRPALDTPMRRKRRPLPSRRIRTGFGAAPWPNEVD